MDKFNLPLTPGSATAPLHPFNVWHVSFVVLRHTLSAFNPDTAVVRRTHHRRRNEGTVDDAVSMASSRLSRRSAAVNVEGRSEQSHRRHRTHSGDSAASDGTTTPSRRRHRLSSLESDKSRRSSAKATTSGNVPRRTRSAEEPLLSSRRASVENSIGGATGSRGSLEDRPLRRSHSDVARGQSRRLLNNVNTGDNGSHKSSRLAPSAPHVLSPAAAAVAASGLIPPLAPAPPVPDIGKPPLRLGGAVSPRSGAPTSDAASRSRHRHHRSSSGTGLTSSSRHSSRSRRNDSDDGANIPDASVIVIRDGGGAGLATALWTWSPKGWWRRFRARNVTRTAYLIDHVIHAVPVAFVHYCCELKRQLASLPLMRFSDSLPALGGAKDTAFRGANHSRSSPSAPDAAAAAASAWLPTEEFFEKAPVPYLGNFLFTRWMLSAVDAYIEKFFFLDESLVVRQLRSRKTLRRLIGWGLRTVSHAIFDPCLLSIVVPLLLAHRSTRSLNASSTLLPPLPPATLLVTVPGVIQGFAVSVSAVVIQRVIMPLSSQLVNRAVLTVFEAVEYIIMRRYAQWSDEDEDEDYDEEDDDDDAASLASGISEGTRSLQSVNTALAAPGTDRVSTINAEKRVRHEQRQLLRERRERRRRRERRQAERENAMRVAVLRAIVYRVIASLAAQSLVDHSLSVLVELLRGRATLHLTGFLQPYATMTASQDGLTWPNLWRYMQRLAEPVGITPGPITRNSVVEDEGVPPVVMALRRVGRAVTQELVVLTTSVLTVSGQGEAITAVQQRAAQTVAAGGIPSAADSAEFMARSVAALSPFYNGVQFTVIDKVLSFYIAVWTRLTKQ